LFAGTYDSGVFRSVDYGTHWAPANEGMTTSYILSFAEGPDGSGGRCVYAGTHGQYVFRSSDNGLHWNQVKSGMTRGYIYSLAAYPKENGGSYLIAGTDEGPFISTDNGDSWQKYNEGLADRDLFAIGFVPTPSGSPLVLVGLVGKGVWKRPISEMVTSVDLLPGNPPREFALGQNYPNPFNPSTTIQYAIAGGGDLGLGARKTMLAVYDVLGRQVAMLVNDVKAPGSYEVRFDASGLASGVYLYRLSAGPFVQCRRMLLLK